MPLEGMSDFMGDGRIGIMLYVFCEENHIDPYLMSSGRVLPPASAFEFECNRRDGHGRIENPVPHFGIFLYDCQRLDS